MRAAAIACATALLAEVAGAQTAPGLQVLEIPGERRPLECSDFPGRAGPAAAALPGGVVARRFVIPRAADPDLPGFPALPERQLLVMWDSAGQPRMVSDHASPRLRGATLAVAMFRPDGIAEGRWTVIAVDSARMDAMIRSGDTTDPRAAGVLRPPVSRDLTPAEVARARELAQWLWPRRCQTPH